MTAYPSTSSGARSRGSQLLCTVIARPDVTAPLAYLLDPDMSNPGRPSAYSPELAAEICARIAAGESLRSVCRSDDMPDERTVRRWVYDDIEGFSPQYELAREMRADTLFEEILEISDTPVIGEKTTTKGDTIETTTGDAIERSRLMVDARKWTLARMAPKKYGDKVMQEITGADGGPLAVETVTTYQLPDNGR